MFLAELEQSDAWDLAELLARNRTFLQPFDPKRPDSYFTAEGQRAEIERNAREREVGVGYAFGIFLPPRRLVGRIALSNVARGAWRNANVGYFVGQEHCRRGYATLAVADVVRFAFVDAGLHRVQAAIMPRNVASIRVVEKNGFRHEGIAERYLEIDGRWEDHAIYAITREEWPVRRRS